MITMEQARPHDHTRTFESHPSFIYGHGAHLQVSYLKCHELHSVVFQLALQVRYQQKNVSYNVGTVNLTCLF